MEITVSMEELRSHARKIMEIFWKRIVPELNPAFPSSAAAVDRSLFDLAANLLSGARKGIGATDEFVLSFRSRSSRESLSKSTN